MPTRENGAQLELLLEATSTLVETKKLVDKIEYDIQVLKTRIGNKGSEGADIAMGDPDPMDIDERIVVGDGDGEADDGRAQSVVSTRSGRSRKQVGVVQLLMQPASLHLTDPKVCICIVGGYICYSFKTGDKTSKTQLIRDKIS
jgi:hypothetical protein